MLICYVYIWVCGTTSPLTLDPKVNLQLQPYPNLAVWSIEVGVGVGVAVGVGVRVTTRNTTLVATNSGYGTTLNRNPQCTTLNRN